MATVTSNRIPTITADIYGAVLTLTFSDGKELVCDASKLAATIRDDAVMHGLKQKLVDAAAIARNTDTGRSATVQDKYEAVKEVLDRITGENPTWNKVRGGEGKGNTTLLVQAIMRLQNKPKAVVQEWLDGKSKEEQAALRKNPKVIDAIRQIQLEQAGDTSATDAMLDELSGSN